MSPGAECLDVGRRSALACKLCLKNRELRRSHIIPEFLFRPLYDEKHSALTFRPDVSGKRLIRKGMRERLLCDKCESHLGKLESYFATIWYGTPKFPKLLENPEVRVAGLDYHQFKLFHLSILWRAGVSSLCEFAQVQLGPHEETLRRMLLDLDPGTARDYPIFGAVMTGPGNKNLCAPTIMSPIRHRFEGLNLYLLAFGSCSWHYYISNHVRLSTEPLALSATGEITLLVTDMTEFSPIDKFMRAKVQEEKVERE